MKEKNLDLTIISNLPPVALSDIKFSVRTTNIFALNNIDTVEKFLSLTTDDFNNLQNLGNTSIQEIKSIQRFLALNYDIDALYGVSKDQVLSFTDTFFIDNGLSVRAINVLNNNNIYTNEQLALYLEDDLKNLNKCGNLTLNEIIKFRKFIIENDDEIKLKVLKKLFNLIHDENLCFYLSDIFEEEVCSNFHYLGIYNLENLINTSDENLNQCLKYFNCIYSSLLVFRQNIKDFLYESILLSVRRPKANGDWSDDWERDLYALHKRAQGATLEDIGNELSLTREGVRQLEKRAVNSFFEISDMQIDCYMRKIFNNKTYLYSSDISDCLYDLSDIFIYFVSTRESNHYFSNIRDSANYLYNKTFDIFMFKNNWIKTVESWFETLNVFFDKNNIDKILDDCRNYLKTIQLDINIDDIKKVFYHVYNHDYKTFISRRKLMIYDILSYILNLYYSDGIDIYNESTLNKVRYFANKIFGIELSEDNRTIAHAIARKGILVDRGIWKLWDGTVLPAKIILSLYNYIERYVIDSVPISAIFEYFKIELEDYGIYNRFYLQGILSRDENFKYNINRDYVLKTSNFSIYKEIEKFIILQQKPVTIDIIVKQFPGVSLSIMQSVTTNTSIINMNGCFASLKNMTISQQDIYDLKQFLDNHIKENKPYYAGELFEFAKNQFSRLFNSNGFVDYLQFYYLINKLFKKDYSFSRPYISIKGTTIIPAEEQLLEFIEDNVFVENVELRNFAKKIGTVIDSLIGFVNRNKNRIAFKNDHVIISSNVIDIDEQKIIELDNIIKNFLYFDFYRSLKDLDENIEFPDFGIEINEWSLFSIINQHSKIYKVVVSSNKMAQAIPIVCKKDFDEKKIKLTLIKNKNLDDYLDMLLLEEL